MSRSVQGGPKSSQEGRAPFTSSFTFREGREIAWSALASLSTLVDRVRVAAEQRLRSTAAGLSIHGLSQIAVIEARQPHRFQ